MGYIGNEAQTAFTSFDKQTITGTGTAVYTLSHNVANEQEIEVFVNNVRQEGGSGKAFTVSGNQITFTENIASTDTVYVNFAGKAVQTVTHPSNQPLQATTGTFSSNVDVGGSLLVDTIKDGAGTNTAMTIDNTGRILTPARPAFSGTHITASGNTGLTGTVIMNTEDFDIGGNYDNSTGIYTVPVTGIYRYSFSGFASSSTGQLTTGQKTVALQTNASGSFADYQGMTGNAHQTGPNSDLGVYIPLSFSGLISATAGNELKIQTIDSNTHIFATVSAVSPYRPRFSIELVG